jgi:hypothetical protein
MQALLGTPRENLRAEDVAEALALGRGANVRHGVDVLDMSDTPTGQTIPFEPGGKVEWSYHAPDRVTGSTGEVAAVRRQAELTIPADAPVNLLGVRLRIWTEWQMLNGDWARFYLGVFTIVNPGARVDDGLIRRRSLQLADKSYLWANKTSTEPLYIPAGTDVLSYIRSGASTFFNETRFALSGTGALTQPRIFEAKTSYLEIWSTLLEAIGNEQVTADELGRLASSPMQDRTNRGVEYTYGAGAGKILTAGSVEPLLPSLPNVVRFVSRQANPSLGTVEGNGLRTKRNQSVGPGSIDARGGTEVEVRAEVEADDQATLDIIANADAQRYFAGGGLTFSGKVALNPRHSDRDIIALNLPRLGVTGDQSWTVTGWTYPLGSMRNPDDALMDITAERRV